MASWERMTSLRPVLLSLSLRTPSSILTSPQWSFTISFFRQPVSINNLIIVMALMGASFFFSNFCRMWLSAILSELERKRSFVSVLNFWMLRQGFWNSGTYSHCWAFLIINLSNARAWFALVGWVSFRLSIASTSERFINSIRLLPTDGRIMDEISERYVLAVLGFTCLLRYFSSKIL